LNAYAQQNACPQRDIDKIELEASRLRSWDALYRSFRQYADYQQCYQKHYKQEFGNASADEGYSESIARILSDHWDTLPRLATLIKQDRKFSAFVHLDATMDMKDVNKIRRLAIQNCPLGLNNLCGSLRKSADSAIAESKQH
jgi:hypothetical protein